MSIRPKDIDTSDWYRFGGSGFRNSECETIARNIVLIQKKINPDAWTDFSWDDYKKGCTHTAAEWERGILNAMVKGGKPVWNTSAALSPGYLELHDDKYRVVQKFIDALPSEITTMTLPRANVGAT